MKRILCGLHFVVWLSAFGPLMAQGQIQLVVPNQFTSTVANIGDVAPLGMENQHLQQEYAGSLLSAAGLSPGDQIMAIGFRLADGEPSLAAQTVTDYSIWMGLAAVSPVNMSTNFVDNRSSMTLVRSGALNIADGQFSGGVGLNPFGMIQLSVPYTYSGGDLLIEISYSNFANGVSVDSAYPFDSSLAGTAFGSGPDATTADQGTYNEAIVMALNVNPVPEPSTLAVVASGLLGLCFITRRRHNS